MKHYDGRIFKGKRNYTLYEISETLGVHLKSVRRWARNGLKVLDMETKPFLVMGRDIRNFLKERRIRHRKTLKVGEFFCPKCWIPRNSIEDKITTRFTGRMLGKTYRQVFIQGVCPICAATMCQFSSDRRLKEWQDGGFIKPERVKEIYGNSICCESAPITQELAND